MFLTKRKAEENHLSDHNIDGERCCLCMTAKDVVYVWRREILSMYEGERCCLCMKEPLVLDWNKNSQIKSILSPRYLFAAVYMQIACQTKLKLCQSPLHPNRICVFICNTSRARAAKARSISGSGNNACPDDIPACSSKLQSAFRTWGMVRCSSMDTHAQS